jgi:hypothetical protein
MSTIPLHRHAAVALCVTALIGLVAAIYGYVVFVGTAWTGGALLVVVSTLLLLGAAFVFAFGEAVPKWLRVTLDVLIVLGILGTFVAGWLLHNWVLALAMIAAAIVELFRLFRAGPPPAAHRRTVAAHPIPPRKVA